MTKILIEPHNEIVKKALLQNLKDIETVDSSQFDVKLRLPLNPIKLGELIDQIENPVKNSFSIGGVDILLDKKCAIFKQKDFGLTEKEISLLAFLNSQDEACSKEDILEEVWGYSADTNTRTVETHLHRLNNKFLDEFGFKIIEFDNIGYKLVNFN